MSALVIRNGTVVTGDGRSVIAPGTIVVVDGRIRNVLHGDWMDRSFGDADRIIDAAGKVVMPGVINNHAHGVCFGPIFPSGHEPLSDEQVLANLDRHLLEGSTTLLSVDGFITPEEVERTSASHPINLAAATCNTAKCLEAAEIADGTGLTDYHRGFNAARALDHGAVALGEIGSGHTLGGGGQDYMYIPEAIKRETGRDLTPQESKTVKDGILTRYIDASKYDEARAAAALEEVGLADVLSPQRARELIEATVLPPFNVALDGLAEAGEVARARNVPLIVHNSAPSKEAVLELAQQETPLVAGHSNHATFDVEEAVEQAEELQGLGATVDVSTLDAFGAKRLVTGLDHIHAMLKEGVVDTVSTDYAGGYHDSVLLLLEDAIDRGLIGLAQGVALVTANVSRAVPGLAPNRGQLTSGMVADIVITSRDALSKIDTVLIGGEVVVDDGKRVVAS